jgi:hypothetical protein
VTPAKSRGSGTAKRATPASGKTPRAASAKKVKQEELKAVSDSEGEDEEVNYDELDPTPTKLRMPPKQPPLLEDRVPRGGLPPFLTRPAAPALTLNGPPALARTLNGPPALARTLTGPAAPATVAPAATLINPLPQQSYPPPRRMSSVPSMQAATQDDTPSPDYSVETPVAANEAGELLSSNSQLTGPASQQLGKSFDEYGSVNHSFGTYGTYGSSGGRYIHYDDDGSC